MRARVGRVFGVVVVVATHGLGGCDRGRAPAGEQTAEALPMVTVAPATASETPASRSAASTPPAASASSAPKPSRVTFAFASFQSGNLDGCADVVVETPPETPAEKIAKYREQANAGLQETAAKNPNFTVLADTCTASFKDRLVLASCTSHPEVKSDSPLALSCDASKDKGCEIDLTGKKGGSTFELTERHYLFESALETDAAMLACLKDKGTWNAIARDSDEYAKAKREAAARKLEKLSKQLGQ